MPNYQINPKIVETIEKGGFKGLRHYVKKEMNIGNMIRLNKAMRKPNSILTTIKAINAFNDWFKNQSITPDFEILVEVPETTSEGGSLANQN